MVSCRGFGNLVEAREGTLAAFWERGRWGGGRLRTRIRVGV